MRSVLDWIWLERLSIRRALVIGFGLTLAIWAAAAYDVSRNAAKVERRAAVINARYTDAHDLLSSVRAQVLLASVSVRDALLDPDPRTSAGYRHELAHGHRAIDGSLRAYAQILGPGDERERFDRLQGEIANFYTTMLDVLATESLYPERDASLLLQSRVAPKRQSVLDLSGQVEALNRAAFVQEEAAIASIYSARQRRTWQGLTLALAASLGIGILAALHAGRLERRLAGQRAQELVRTRQLQELSSRLIDAQEEERRTIARELHDEVGQVLTAIKVELAVAQRAIEADGGRVDILSDARSVTEGALQTVRDLSHLLRPALLDDLGLPEALAWYARGFGRRHHVRADLESHGMRERLPAEVEAAVYRIVQEALTNVARHARASSCRVRLHRAADTLIVSVEDDGIGFRAAAAPSRGLGLVGIRERVSNLRGALRVDSAPGEGTRLVVRFPLGVTAPAAAGHRSQAAAGRGA